MHMPYPIVYRTQDSRLGSAVAGGGLWPVLHFAIGGLLPCLCRARRTGVWTVLCRWASTVWLCSSRLLLLHVLYEELLPRGPPSGGRRDIGRAVPREQRA